MTDNERRHTKEAIVDLLDRTSDQDLHGILLFLRRLLGEDTA